MLPLKDEVNTVALTMGIIAYTIHLKDDIGIFG